MTTDIGRDPSGQALAVPVEPVSRLDPSGFDPSRWRELAERCEEKAGPSYELDREIAKACGWLEILTFGYAWQDPKGERHKLAPRCTTSLDAAKLLLDPRALWAVGDMEDGPFARVCWPMPNGGYGGGYVEGRAATVMLSLCAAALRGRAIAMEARQRPDREAGLDPKGDSAGRQASPNSSGDRV